MPDVIQLVIQATDTASKVIGGVGDSLDKLDKSSDSASKKLSIFGLTTDQIGSKMTKAGKIATVGLTLPIAGLAVAATKAASDLNETSTKIETLFGNASGAIKKFADTAATSLGQSKKQALDAAADFAIFGKAAGLAGNDLVNFSEKNVTLAADMASFFNTSPEEAITAIGAAFRGESEPIRRYGILINEASLKDEALRLGLIKTTSEALQPQARVLAAQALIFKQTSAAQGDFAKTSGGLANQSRILNAQFENTVATLGQNLLPIAIKMATTANDLLKAFSDLDQPTKDLIVGFGLLAAAAGPVLTVGGKLVSTFGTLTSVAIEAAGGIVSTGKTIAETAGYLKQVGLSAESLKFAFQNLKAAGVVLGVELGIIVAGLIAVAKYLGEVDAASKATNEDLIAMSRSGDVFKQAAATTEILAHGQDRLKVALDGTHEKIRAGAKDYADYESSIKATAAAAGYEIDAQGNLVSAIDNGMGAGKRLIQANYLLSESTYKIGGAQNYVTTTAGNQAKSTDVLSQAIDRAKKGSQEYTAITQDQIDGMKALADATRSGGEAEKIYSDFLKDNLEVRKFYNKQISDTTTIAIQFTQSQRDQAKVQDELDKLNEKIAARGPARTVSIKNEKLSTEELTTTQLKLAAAQEDLTTAKRKGDETDAEFALRLDTLKSKVADYSQKLGEHTAVVGGATKAELEQKTALEGQIAAIQKSVEVQRAKGAFDSLTKAFEDGILTEAQYQERMTALNSISGFYTDAALKQAIAQETLMKAFADPRGVEWYTQLVQNKDAIDGVVAKTGEATKATENLSEAQGAHGEELAAQADKATAATKKVGEASIEAAQRALDFKNKNEAAAKKSQEEAERLAQAHGTAARKISGENEGLVTSYKAVADAARGIQKEIVPAISKEPTDEKARIAARDKAIQDTESSSKKAIGSVSSTAKTATGEVTNAVDVTDKKLTALATTTQAKFITASTSVQNAMRIMASTAGIDLFTIYQAVDKLPTFKEFIYKITVKGEVPSGLPGGAQYGADFIVPANPRGGAGDYFPILAAPGERVTVQTKAQQNAAPAPALGGDTFNYVTNVYNPLAAAMLADKQRRDRLARSNARMGVT